MKPFLNWPGGKRWLVATHPEVLEINGARLVEPFLGSGAVYFHVEPAAALLSDSNFELIETYSVVRDCADDVLEALRRHQVLHGLDHYYEVRASRPKAVVDRAARFIYLNRTCFNGLYRVNLKGEFNVPKGSKEHVLHPDDDFEAWARLLKGAELFAQDFEKTVDMARAGDFLYVDPPYTVKHNMNNFVKYNERIFSWSDQVRLAEALVRASGRGVRILISNADHASVRELYSSSEWGQVSLERHSRLAASSVHRKPTTEIMISNRTAGIGASPIQTSEVVQDAERSHWT